MLLLNVDTLQNAAVQGESGELTLSFFELATKGGWIMIILAFLSVVAVYIFIDRFIAIKKASKEQKSFMDNIRNFILEGKIEQALDTCRINDGPIARMIEKGVMRIGRPLSDVNTAIENVGKQEVAKLEKGLPILASIAGGAPMIGFLGTVIGMVRAFYDMATAGNNIDVTLLSNGIYTAMVTTVGGLVVGIIAYFGYNILVARVSNLVTQLEAKTTEFMDILNQPVK
ncbi:MAG TPA: MotA/TolQ/ExbB proton channel family protein [Bacteroidales bacterium]|jgi:biopolymer transport protein ExbB|nr:MotA/TolQ/ExbB proton channel family protein [Bacteroidales bacterium]HOL97430.1 MotA/TolQ/ExbB proton channel family protein [Bacteroidales bacterium]HUM31769.1 MotA/TolQ/ExbB proton channel family protein [Bacteroidales bacterium]